MSTKADHIIEFYGQTCPHCASMKPVIAKLEQDLGIEIDKKEVWEHPENRKVMDQYIDVLSEACGGFAAVPSYVNTQTKQALCGAHDAADLKILIEGGDCSGNVCKAHSKMPEK